MGESLDGALTPRAITIVGGSDGTHARPLQVTQDGELVVSGGGGGEAEGATGAAVPVVAILIGGSDGTNLRGVAVDASGVLQVDLAGVNTSDPLLVDSATLATAAAQATLQTKLTDGSARVGGTVTTDSSAADGVMAGDGRKTVTTAGTAVALAASTACKWVIVTAFSSNTDRVAVGTSSVLAAAGSQRGKPLAPGESFVLPATNLSGVYVDSRVNGEGVAYLYGN